MLFVLSFRGCSLYFALLYTCRALQIPRRGLRFYATCVFRITFLKGVKKLLQHLFVLWCVVIGRRSWGEFTRAITSTAFEQTAPRAHCEKVAHNQRWERQMSGTSNTTSVKVWKMFDQFRMSVIKNLPGRPLLHAPPTLRHILPDRVFRVHDIFFKQCFQLSWIAIFGIISLSEVAIFVEETFDGFSSRLSVLLVVVSPPSRAASGISFAEPFPTVPESRYHHTWTALVSALVEEEMHVESTLMPSSDPRSLHACPLLPGRTWLFEETWSNQGVVGLTPQFHWPHRTSRQSMSHGRDQESARPSLLHEIPWCGWFQGCPERPLQPLVLHPTSCYHALPRHHTLSRMSPNYAAPPPQIHPTNLPHLEQEQGASTLHWACILWRTPDDVISSLLVILLQVSWPWQVSRQTCQMPPHQIFLSERSDSMFPFIGIEEAHTLDSESGVETFLCSHLRWLSRSLVVLSTITSASHQPCRVHWETYEE